MTNLVKFYLAAAVFAVVLLISALVFQSIRARDFKKELYALKESLQDETKYQHLFMSERYRKRQDRFFALSMMVPLLIFLFCHVYSLYRYKDLPTVEESYDMGYEVGYESGKDNCIEEFYQTFHEESYNEGYSDGYADGLIDVEETALEYINVGFDFGHSHGYNAGYHDGWIESRKFPEEENTSYDLVYYIDNQNSYYHRFECPYLDLDRKAAKIRSLIDLDYSMCPSCFY